MPEKLKLEREKRQLDTKRDEAWKHYEQAAKEIEARNDALIDVVEKAMQQAVSEAQLFTVCWKIA